MHTDALVKLFLIIIKPYRNPTLLRIATRGIFRENIFYIFEKLNVFVKHCSLSLPLS